MISKFFNKLKSILGKKSSPEIAKPKKAVQTSKTTKKSKTAKTVKKAKTKKPTKSKKKDSKLIIESFTKLPGVGAKSAKALYDAGFKTTNDIISAKEEVLLAVPGVGINLVKKLKNIKV